MTPDQLKASILKMAVSGKLVHNNEKEQVTIPKDEWEGDEQPFDLPNNWIWKKFSYFGELRMGKTILKNELLKEGVPVYSATQSDDVLGYLKKVELELHADDLVIPARGNSIGFVTIIRDAIATCTQTTICCKDIHDILPAYLYYCCYAFKPVWFKYSGSAIPQVTVAQISKCMVPVPPIEEQKRIVNKIEELLPYVDRYAESYEKLEQFNAKFPEDMKKSILQYAIQGKLVEQRPEEGTAEDLYQQIQDEKQKLIKEGKIKKEKPLAEITEDEIPFDIPESWKWCKMGSLYNIHSSKRVHAKDYTKEGVPFYRSMEVVSLAKGIEPTVQYYISEEQYNGFVKDQYIMPQKDDLLITCIGGSIGWTWIVDDSKFYYKDGNVVAFDKCNVIDTKYLYYWLNSPKFVEQVQIDVGGTAYNALTIDMLKNYLLPLPPIEEQHRIVSKIEEMLPYCDRLVK